MARWSRQQIALMALTAGWGARAQDVSWVAMAESGGDDKVVNSIGCVGLLQINQPVHVGSHPTWTRAWLQDPVNNLTAGKVLFDAAGKSFDGPWADSKHKGGIPEGWGPHVSGGTAQASDDDPCAWAKGTPAYDYCKKSYQDPDREIPLDPNAPVDTAQQLGRLAQAVAKAGNWVSNPDNWVRVAYVVGGGVLALVAVNVVLQPYAARAYRQVYAALPVKTTKRVVRSVRGRDGQEEE